MTDTRNPSEPPNAEYDNCQHEWEDVESMSENEVRCIKCGVPGDRCGDGTVYWPAT